MTRFMLVTVFGVGVAVLAPRPDPPHLSGKDCSDHAQFAIEVMEARQSGVPQSELLTGDEVADAIVNLAFYRQIEETVRDKAWTVLTFAGDVQAACEMTQ